MSNETAELIGIFALVVGFGLIVAAAAMVAPALAVLVLGVGSLFCGVLTVHLANSTKAKERTP